MSRRLTAIGVAALVAAGALLGLDALLGESPAGPARVAGPTHPAATANSPVATGPAAPTEPAAPAGQPDITVLMSGDVLLRDTLWAQARADAQARGADGYDFRPMLAGVRDAVSGADVAICHLETPVGAAGGPYSDYPVFNVPRFALASRNRFFLCIESQDPKFDIEGTRHFLETLNPREVTTVAD